MVNDGTNGITAIASFKCSQCGEVLQLGDNKCPNCRARIHRNNDGLGTQLSESPLHKKHFLKKYGAIISALAILGILILVPWNEIPYAPPTSGNVVSNNPRDGSVSQVKDWLLKNVQTPESLKFIEWGKVEKLPTGSTLVQVKYSYKMPPGMNTIESKIFVLDSLGKVIRQSKLN